MRQDRLAWALGLLMALIGIWLATGRPPETNAGNLLPPPVREALWEQDRRAQDLAAEKRREERLAQAGGAPSALLQTRTTPPRGDDELCDGDPRPAQDAVLVLEAARPTRPASRIVLGGPKWLPPRGAVVTAACLRLFGLGTGTPDAGGPEVYENEQPYDPQRRVLPVCGAVPIAFVNFPGDINQWLEVDLTHRVQAWTDGEPCHGVTILPPAQGTWHFASSHSEVRAVRPHYRIEFIPPAEDNHQG